MILFHLWEYILGYQNWRTKPTVTHHLNLTTERSNTKSDWQLQQNKYKHLYQMFQSNIHSVHRKIGTWLKLILCVLNQQITIQDNPANHGAGFSFQWTHIPSGNTGERQHMGPLVGRAATGRAMQGSRAARTWHYEGKMATNWNREARDLAPKERIAIPKMGFQEPDH